MGQTLDGLYFFISILTSPIIVFFGLSLFLEGLLTYIDVVVAWFKLSADTSTDRHRIDYFLRCSSVIILPNSTKILPKILVSKNVIYMGRGFGWSFFTQSRKKQKEKKRKVEEMNAISITWLQELKGERKKAGVPEGELLEGRREGCFFFFFSFIFFPLLSSFLSLLLPHSFLHS